MQAIIVEPFLKNKSGHQYAYTVALQAELEKRNIEVLVLGNKQADQECLKIKNFFPVLTDVSGNVFKFSLNPLKLFQILNSIRRLSDQLDNFFFNQIDLQSLKKNIIFIHSLYIFELLSLGFLLEKKHKAFIKNDHKVIIGFNFGYMRNSPVATLLLRFLYKNIFCYLIKDAKKQVIYFADGELLADEYEKLLKKRVYLLPPPLNNKFLVSFLEKPSSTNKGKNIHISFLGGARYNKGFDLFVRIVERLTNEPAMNERISFFVQVDIHPQQTRREQKVVEKYVRLLKDLDRRNHNIQLRLGSLSLDEYYKRLFETDLLVLPYRVSSFRSVPSNIFREGVVLGKVVLVPKKSSMAFELAKYKLEELCFDVTDFEDIMKSVTKTINNMDAYQARIREVQGSWSAFFSAEELVTRIFSISY